MKRRNFLGLGAVATAGTAASAGCLSRTLEAMAPATTPDDFLALLDRHLPLVDQARFVDGFVGAMRPGPRTPDQEQVVRDHDGALNRMLRTLIISQGFRELPPETQLEPRVQQRMTGHLDEVGSTVFEVSERLAALTPAQRAGLRDVLREQPELPMRIAEEIDGHAAVAGISRTRRAQLRSMMSTTAFRLKTGDPGALVDEYVAKVERVRAQTDNDARALDLAQKLGERAFWRYQKHLAAQPSQTYPASSPSPSPGPAPAAPSPRRGRGGIKAGAYMMGIGTVTFGVSLALVNTAEGFVFGVTLGAVLFAIGFLALIIGALMYLGSG